MNWLIRQIAKVTLIGKLVEKLGPKVPIIFIFIALIFTAFYIPYEYENFLEFKFLTSITILPETAINN